MDELRKALRKAKTRYTYSVGEPNPLFPNRWKLPAIPYEVVFSMTDWKAVEALISQPVPAEGAQEPSMFEDDYVAADLRAAARPATAAPAEHTSPSGVSVPPHVFKHDYCPACQKAAPPSTPARPIIVCLCGSTRFREAWVKHYREESLAGKIVLSVGVMVHAGDEPIKDGPVKGMLDELHKRKIDLADEILVLNVGQYVGDSTRSEINYAGKHGKKIRYLETPNHCADCGYRHPPDGMCI